MKVKTNPWKRLYLFEILFIALSLCFLAVGDEIWFDEVFSVSIVKHSFSDIISFTAADVHPPLYYFILKLFTLVFGQRMSVYHLVSIIPFVLMLLAIGRFVSKHFGFQEAMLSVLLVTAAPNMLMYAVEIRMYSLCCLFVVLSMILAVELCENPDSSKTSAGWFHRVLGNKKWAAFAVVNVLAAYSHYFAGAAVLLVAGCLFVFFLLQKENRKKNLIHWFLSMAATGVLYLPWLIVFYQQLTKVKKDYWIEGFHIGTLMEYEKFIFGSDAWMKILTEVLFLLAVCAVIYFWKNEKKDRIFFLNGFSFFGLIASGVLLSILITPVFMRRYIIVVLPLFWITVVCALMQIKHKGVFLALGLCGLLLFSVNYEKEFFHRNHASNTTMLYLLQEEMGEKDVIYSAHCYLMADAAVYFPEQERYLPEEAMDGQAFAEWGALTDTKMVEDAESFCEEGHQTVWLLELYKDDIEAEEKQNVRVFEENGYNVIDKGEQTIGWGDGYTDFLTVHVYLCEMK